MPFYTSRVFSLCQMNNCNALPLSWSPYLVEGVNNYDKGKYFVILHIQVLGIVLPLHSRLLSPTTTETFLSDHASLHRTCFTIVCVGT